MKRMSGDEPEQERDARSYGMVPEMQAKSPTKRLKKRSKRGLIRKGRRAGRR